MSKLQNEDIETDVKLDNVLRPNKLDQFIGQQIIKDNLSIAIQAAKKRNECLSHVLFYGAPGLGKTTLAQIISNEIGSSIKITSGPAIEKTGDLASQLSNLEEGDVLFIDEIHRLPKVVEEMLYPAMEDYCLDVVLGKGLASKSMRLQLPKFTLIGATTKIGHISSPLRDRFGHIYHLNFYDIKEIQEIIKRSTSILGIDIEDIASLEIAKRSRRTPRIANRLIDRVRDLSEVNNEPRIYSSRALESMELLGIDSFGLDAADRQILDSIVNSFSGGPVGLSTLAAATSHEKETIEDVIEPYLIQLGLIQRTSRGRIITPAGKLHMGIDVR